MNAPVIPLPAESMLPMFLGLGGLAGFIVGVAFFLIARRSEMTPRILAGMVVGIIAGLILVVAAITTFNGNHKVRSDEIRAAVKQHFDVTLTGEVPAKFGVADQNTWEAVGSIPGRGGQRCTLKDTDTSDQTATLDLSCDALKIEPVR